MKIKSDFLQIVQERGFFHQCSNLEALDKLLLSGKKTGYLGIDPTADSMHVGHLVGIMLLRWFQKTGHQAIALIGGGTAKIGDPSGKDDMRQMLLNEEIDHNVTALGISIQRLLKNAGQGPILVNNDDWLKNLNYMDFLRVIGKHFTINRMITFDSVKIRLDRQHPLTFLEFNYMILQAYDFLELYKANGCILQLGGSDQWGNIVNGIDLIHKMLQKEVFGLTVPLLTTSSGAKMGKTSRGAVWLDANKLNPYDYWQYWRNTEDADVVRYLKLFTELPMTDIQRLAMLQGSEINEAKKILADEATAIVHGKDSLDHIHALIAQHFNNDQHLDEGQATILNVDQPLCLMDLISHPLINFSFSRSEIRRLLASKAVKIDDQTISDEKYILASRGAFLLSVGKKNKRLIKIIQTS